MTVLAAVGGGLLLGYRVDEGRSAASTAFAPNAFLRIGTDGRITLIMPQVEMGQASPESRLLLTTACEEIAAIALEEGVPLPADAVDRVIQQAAAMPPQWRSSMARDLADGRRLEVEALSGAVVRRGLKLGIPTPIHGTIAACLSVHQPSAAAAPHTPR